MATYRSGDFKYNNGDLCYAIQKKHWFAGWIDVKCWAYGTWYTYAQDVIDEDAKKFGKKEMENTVKRLVKAGHTVI